MQTSSDSFNQSNQELYRIDQRTLRFRRKVIVIEIDF